MPGIIFSAVLSSTIFSSVFAAVALLLRFLLMNRVSKAILTALWLLVFLRFALPFPIPSPTSFYNVVPVQSASVSNPDAGMYQNSAYFISQTSTETNNAANDASISGAADTAEEQSPAAPNFSAKQIPEYIYFGVLVFLLLFIVSSYINILVKIKSSSCFVYPEFENLRSEFGLHRRCKVVVSPYFKSPSVFGFFFPVMIFPESFDFSDAAAAKHIIGHEIQHIRRFDNLFNLLIMFAVCLNWFNPMVWICAFLSQKDIEAACDEGVLRRLGADTRYEYAATLLKMAMTQVRVVPSVLTGFGGSDVKKRVKWVLKYKKVTVISTIAVCTLIAAVAVIFATGKISEVGAFHDSFANGGSSQLSSVSDSSPSQNDSASGNSSQVSSMSNNSPSQNGLIANVPQAGEWAGTAYLNFNEQRSILYNAGITYTLSKDGSLVFSYKNKNQTISFPYKINRTHNPCQPGVYASEGRLAVAYCNDKNQFTIAYSNDKGKTWRFAKSITQNFTGKGMYAGQLISVNDSDLDAASIGFTSSNDGWCVLKGNNACGSECHAIFTTKDGGQNWVYVDSNLDDVFCHQMSGVNFINKNTGFMGFTNQFYPITIFKTQDGGKTWNRVLLNMPDKYSDIYTVALSPYFIGKKGYFPLAVNAGFANNKITPSMIFFVSSDGGQTWSYEPSMDVFGSQ